jgi:hypothetical protein
MAEQDFLPKPSVVRVCGIGASAGGLEALHKFFGAPSRRSGLGLRGHPSSGPGSKERLGRDRQSLDENAGDASR